MTKKLFYVEITHSGWVLAEDKFDAESFADEIVDGEDYSEITVSGYKNVCLKESGWSRDCLVYHDILDENDKLKEITLGQALDELDKNQK